MAQLGPTPILQIPDASEVFTYNTGASTTEKPTYFDVGLLIKNPNPIPLDSIEEHKCYMLEDAEYRFVIKNTAGSTLHTVDNINPIINPAILTADMNVNGNSIVSSSAGDIAITPDGNGYIILDGQKWPRSDSTAGFVLGTDGSGNLSWIGNGSFWSPDTTPQLGGALDANTFNIKFKSGNGFRDDSDNEQLIFRTTSGAVNQIDITNAATGTGPTIAATGDDTDINLNINSKGSRGVVIDNLIYPTSDGSSGQSLISDGIGNLSFGVITSNSANASQVVSAQGDLAIRPSLLHNHPGIPVVWFWRKEGQSDVSYGVTNVSSAGSHLRINFITAMSSVNYAVVATDAYAATSHLIVNDVTTTYVDLKVRNKVTSTSFTPKSFGIAVFGEQVT